MPLKVINDPVKGTHYKVYRKEKGGAGTKYFPHTLDGLTDALEYYYKLETKAKRNTKTITFKDDLTIKNLYLNVNNSRPYLLLNIVDDMSNRVQAGKSIRSERHLREVFFNFIKLLADTLSLSKMELELLNEKIEASYAVYRTKYLKSRGLHDYR